MVGKEDTLPPLTSAWETAGEVSGASRVQSNPSTKALYA